MIPDWKPKKLTFLIIPEANRQVRRLSLPVFWLYFVPAAVLFILAGAAVFTSAQNTMLQQNSEMKAGLQTELARLEQTAAGKQSEIERLQGEVVRLSQEAEAFSAKMEELKSLEREILAVTGEEEPEEVTAEAAFEEDGGVTILSAAGVGGQYIPVGTEGALELSDTTHASYEEMALEAERLKASLNDALKEVERLAYIRSITPSIFPTISTRITSTFGYRKDPFTKKSARHNGIDFGGDVGDPVFATAGGTVSRTGYDKAMGNHVLIKHGNGLETVYMHLSKSLVKKGQNVKKGEKIGLLGSTGRSTGPHLHYEVHKNGTAINPKPYIND